MPGSATAPGPGRSAAESTAPVNVGGMQTTLTNVEGKAAPPVRSPAAMPTSLMVVAPPLPKAPPVRCLHVVKWANDAQSALVVQGKGPLQVPPGHAPTSLQALPSIEPPTQRPKEVPNCDPQEPQKMFWPFMTAAVLWEAATEAVESVVSENGMGRPPILALGGGGQSWLVGYGSPEAESPGVQSLSWFGPPLQHVPDAQVPPAVQSGQGWMPGTAGRSDAEPSRKSPV